jgi:hypothetical protein
MRSKYSRRFGFSRPARWPYFCATSAKESSRSMATRLGLAISMCPSHGGAVNAHRSILDQRAKAYLRWPSRLTSRAGVPRSPIPARASARARGFPIHPRQFLVLKLLFADVAHFTARHETGPEEHHVLEKHPAGVFQRAPGRAEGHPVNDSGYHKPRIKWCRGHDDRRSGQDLSSPGSRPETQ